MRAIIRVKIVRVVLKILQVAKHGMALPNRKVCTVKIRGVEENVAENKSREDTSWCEELLSS